MAAGFVRARLQRRSQSKGDLLGAGGWGGVGWGALSRTRLLGFLLSFPPPFFLR